MEEKIELPDMPKTWEEKVEEWEKEAKEWWESRSFENQRKTNTSYMPTTYAEQAYRIQRCIDELEEKLSKEKDDLNAIRIRWHKKPQEEGRKFYAFTIAATDSSGKDVYWNYIHQWSPIDVLRFIELLASKEQISDCFSHIRGCSKFRIQSMMEIDKNTYERNKDQTNFYKFI